MALESSGGLRSSSSPIKLRSSLVVLSAGAALVALIGYLFMKSRQSPPASKQSSSSSSSTTSSTTATSKSEKSQVAEEEEKQEEDNLERISQELVRIVLNCAAKKMANDSDDFTHLMSNESKRSESKRNRNRTSGGADETELDEATHELSMHSISLLETDSSSSSSAAEHTTSIIESPNVSYHQETSTTSTSNQQKSTNLTKSSSTTSTASTASSATVEPSQQQRQFTNKQTQSSKQQHNKKVSSQHQKTNKPKPLNVHNRITNDKQKPLPKSNHQMSESQEETQRQQQQHHNESQPVSLNSSTTADANHEDIIVYEFNFPRKFCGKLIGKNGVHVDHIRSKTRTQIAVRDDADNHEQQIVCVSGRLEDVDQALDIISSRFPLKQYPTISFKPISKPIVYRRINNEVESDRVLPYESTSVKKVLVAPNMFVEIKPAAIEPMNVHVSAVVNASHVFVQFPDNSTYASLQKLDECMFEVYSRQSNNNNESSSEEPVPIMSEPIEFGSICVAPTSYGWHRAMVTTYLSLDEARAQYADYGEECGLATVKFLDYGGYLTIPANQLRQLRSDFMLLPFQAVECYLDGIFVNQGTEEEGKKFLTEIIKGAQIKLSLCGYAEDGIPLIKLFLTNDIYQNVNLNSELINYSNNL